MIIEFLAGLILGLVFIIVGLVLINFPPCSMTWGYRTPASTRNRQTWEEANRYAGKLSVIGGIILMIHGAMIHYLFSNKEAIWAISTIVLLILLSFLLFFLTERRLSKIFDKEGKRKS